MVSVVVGAVNEKEKASIKKGEKKVGVIDARRLSSTWTAEDSRSVPLITATRNAHIIIIFIKHLASAPFSLLMRISISKCSLNFIDSFPSYLALL